mmetsp:Transcript_41771/g.72495  ORF Transcript_41771/g.72495 Transcript_41771/m.72495 type:complete len:219 (-) Transcript_41771:89-745(-)|eukprot:CAMPEP_0184989858 /NCGR_PEP_ID=MMETSP1098-20130426/30442_1 /TAXON_ID=89044 /ORGANISM="Spumella elongata, Strain CCAP 955/1" /LENGTH=218 /DNA_ID=CAMNT_0027514945 /DNA_START=49 /DNA_END=705 /DNA_ORIENTATION=-
MTSSLCNTRLRKEYKDLQKKPVENIRAAPKETNILEWHYVIEGQKGSPFEGGFYHGTVVFPPEYPYKPPSIQMLTPNGRFKPNTRLCLSMSDFHPESWNPMWSVGTILMGLYSFMLEEAPTYGSIVTSAQYKRQAAAESLEFNNKNKIFCELFPDLVELYQERKKTIAAAPTVGAAPLVSTEPSLDIVNGNNNTPWAAVLGVFVAIIAFTWAMLALAL